MLNMFTYCTGVTNIPKMNLTDKLTNLGGAFYGCKLIEELDWLEDCDLTSVTNMASTFYGCTNLKRIPNLNTSSKLTTINQFAHSCSNLVSVGNIDTSGVTTAGGNNQGSFLSCTSLESLPTFDMSNCTIATRFVGNCKALKELNFINMDSMTTFNDGYANGDILYGNTASVTKITGLNLSKMSNAAAHLNYGILMSSNLVDVELEGTIKESFSISGCTNISVDSLMNFINALEDVSATKTFKMGATNLEKLSDEQKSIAINKGWTLV
jgi:surface protein